MKVFNFLLLFLGGVVTAGLAIYDTIQVSYPKNYIFFSQQK